MSARLEQVNLSYNAKEDRLLLRVRNSDGQEYRLWMTRRFTGLLWDVTGRIIRETDLSIELDTAAGRDAVLEFEHEQALQRGDFATEYNESASSFPLGEDGKLAFKITYNKLEGNRISLNLLPEDGPGISMGVDSAMLHNLCKLIADSTRSAGWNLELGMLAGSDSENGKRVLN